MRQLRAALCGAPPRSHRRQGVLPAARDVRSARWLVIDHHGGPLRDMLGFINRALRVPRENVFFACLWIYCGDVPSDAAASGPGVLSSRRLLHGGPPQRWLTYALDPGSMSHLAEVFDAMAAIMRRSHADDTAWRVSGFLKFHRECSSWATEPVADVLVCQFPGVQCLGALYLARHTIVRLTHRWDHLICGLPGSAGIPAELQLPLSLEWGRTLQALNRDPAHIVAANNHYDAAYFKHHFGGEVMLWPSLAFAVGQHYAPHPAHAKQALLAPQWGGPNLRNVVGATLASLAQPLDIFTKPGLREINPLIAAFEAAGWSLRTPWEYYGTSASPTREHLLGRLARHPLAVVIPYSPSSALVLELHAIGMPLFAPSPGLLAEMHQRSGVMQHRCCDHKRKCGTKVLPCDFGVRNGSGVPPHDSGDPAHLRQWLENCDIYHLPHVQQFDSPQELVERVIRLQRSGELQALSARMLAADKELRHQASATDGVVRSRLDQMFRVQRQPAAPAPPPIQPPPGFYAAPAPTPAPAPAGPPVAALRWLVFDGHAAPHEDWLRQLQMLGVAAAQVASVCFHMYCKNNKRSKLADAALSARWAEALRPLTDQSGDGVINTKQSRCRARECASAGRWLSASGKAAFRARMLSPAWRPLLDSIDAVACNFPAHQCMALAGFNKTVVIRFSHRFDHWTRPVDLEALLPDTTDHYWALQWPVINADIFVSELQQFAASPLHIVGSTNAYDWAYLRHYTGISATPMPSLGAASAEWGRWSPRADPSGAIPIMPGSGPAQSAIYWFLAAARRHEEQQRRDSPRLRRVDLRYAESTTWGRLAGYPFVVALPYSMHAGAIVEVYSLGVPILAPDAELWSRLNFDCGIMGHTTAHNLPRLTSDYMLAYGGEAVQNAERQSPTHGVSPVAPRSAAEVLPWMQLGDLWQLPNVTHFRSPEHLVELARELLGHPERLRRISADMYTHWQRLRQGALATSSAALAAAARAARSGVSAPPLGGAAVMELSDCKLDWYEGCTAGRVLPQESRRARCRPAACNCDPTVKLRYHGKLGFRQVGTYGAFHWDPAWGPALAGLSASALVFAAACRRLRFAVQVRPRTV
eukprot:TRINITY_DN46_c1_g2_i1.p1 TRINITY_DN46_c1_g2~~TRINITY_DN46_c1_g2_i1.p1  ORF type:complete len:1098 (+),score=344.30 TRINITY_DN46_c1_g2_i1:339-3632(+)